jgi:mannan endo-1,4-beta-mannosidase
MTCRNDCSRSLLALRVSPFSFAMALAACGSDTSEPAASVPGLPPAVTAPSEPGPLRAPEGNGASTERPVDPEGSRASETNPEAVVPAGVDLEPGGANGPGSAPEASSEPNAAVPATSGTFRVNGRHLFDRCGERVVLRGINEMVVWSAGRDGLPEFSEIAKTGANVVRIVWTDEGTAEELDQAVANAVAQQLIPLVEHHGATGDLSQVPAVVDYWTRPDVVAVLEKHERYLLLNIANEAGDSVTPGDFQSTYQAAIDRLRQAGLVLPLIIDGPGWGQDIDTLQATGRSLLEHDPEHNLMFSVHMWWADATGDRVTAELAESVSLGLPLIVGEFAQHAVYMCDGAPFAYRVLLARAQEQQVGWLAWSWGAVDNGDCANQGSFDMTTGGAFGNWEETWGEEVAVTDPNSIQNTSVRPQSMLNGECQ